MTNSFMPELNPKTILAIFLSRISFLTPRDKYKLFFLFDDINPLLSANIAALERMLQRKIRSKNWHPRKTLLELQYNIQWLHTHKAWTCVLGDSNYPFLLSNIADPPVILYGRGNINCLYEKSIAIVGTRKPNNKGIKASMFISHYFATLGWNIVSGLAYGIDIAAHKKILEQKPSEYVDNKNKDDTKKQDGNKAVAVLGTGIDYIYPKGHGVYARAILENNGAVVSELPPASDSLVRQHSFIARNRIISGLSEHVFIIQSPKKSGALATADFANEQGRNVWVHSVGLENEFEGTKQLYQDGAPVIDIVLKNIENSFLIKNN